MVDGKTGYVVAARDVPRFAEKVIDLLANDAKRQTMGRVARQRAETHFHIGTTASRYTALYEELLTRNSRA